MIIVSRCPSAADGVVEAAVETAVGVGGGHDEVEVAVGRVEVGEVGVVDCVGDAGGGSHVVGFDGFVEGGGRGGVHAEQVDVGDGRCSAHVVYRVMEGWRPSIP